MTDLETIARQKLSVEPYTLPERASTLERILMLVALCLASASGAWFGLILAEWKGWIPL